MWYSKISKDGNRLKYVSNTGEEIKEYRKVWEAGGDVLDQVMKDFSNLAEEVTTNDTETETVTEKVVEPITEE